MMPTALVQANGWPDLDLQGLGAARSMGSLYSSALCSIGVKLGLVDLEVWAGLSCLCSGC